MWWSKLNQISGCCNRQNWNLKKIECASLNEYQVYHLSRQESQGGGIALGVDRNLKSTLIKEGTDETEALSVWAAGERTKGEKVKVLGVPWRRS